MAWSSHIDGLKASFRWPAAVVDLVCLGALISASVLVLTTAGITQLLSEAGSDALPAVYILLAAVSIPLASTISAALGRWSTALICKIVCAGALLVCVLLQLASAIGLPATATALCVTAYVLEIIFDTLFWLVVAEHLPTREMKRYTPQLAMAFGVGGVVGGLLAMGFCHIFEAGSLTLLATALLGVCLLQYIKIERRQTHLTAGGDEEEEEEEGLVEALRSTWGAIRAFPITGAIATSILLMSALFCLQDYLTNTIFRDSFSDDDALARFMALVYAGQQAAELAILAVCGRFVIDRAGPILRNLIFPLVTVTFLVALLGWWGLTVAVLINLNANAASNAIFEPVKTLNYASLPHRVLGSVRMLVEGVIYPLGIGLSGLALLVLQEMFSPAAILLLAIGLAVVFAAVSAGIGVLFVPSLIRSLRLRASAPNRYRRTAWTRMFSRADVAGLLSHSDPEARHLGRELAIRLSVSLRSDAAVDLELDGLTAGEEAMASSPAGDAVGAPGLWSGIACTPLAAGPLRIAIRGRVDSAARSADLELLAEGLEEPCMKVRQATARSLVRFGVTAIPMLARRLASERPEVAEAAIVALGGIDSRKARRLLRDHLQPFYERARLNLAGLDAVEQLRAISGDASPIEAVAQALDDSNRLILRRVMAVKAALGNSRDVALLKGLIGDENVRVRSDAIEALASLRTGSLIRPLLPLLENAAASPENAEPVRARTGPKTNPIGVLSTTAEKDRWVRLLAGPLLPALQPQKAGEDVMLDLVLFLKSVPLFQALSFDAIARATDGVETVSLKSGEALCRAGDRMSCLDVVRSGMIEVEFEGRVVETLTRGGLIGDAILIGEDHYTVAAKATADCVVLRFAASLITDLAAEEPRMLQSALRHLNRSRYALYRQLAVAQSAEPPPRRPKARVLELVHSALPVSSSLPLRARPGMALGTKP